MVPVLWNLMGTDRVAVCSTHPEAPTGLVVLPGVCDSGKYASIVVENESALPITVSEKDFIAAGVDEGALPSLEECAAVQRRQGEFLRNLDWSSKRADTIKVVPSPKRDGRSWW